MVEYVRDEEGNVVEWKHVRVKPEKEISYGGTEQEKPMLRSECMNGLVKDNNLYHEEDLFELKFGSRSTWIIKRQGIEKIQYNNGIEVKIDWIRMEKDYAVVKATAKRGDVVIETYGSAWHGDGGNCKRNYVAEMAV